MQSNASLPWIRAHWRALLVTAIVAFVVLATSGFFLAQSLMKGSDLYKLATTIILQDTEVLAALGEPIEFGSMVSGEINIRNKLGDGVLQIPVSGPKSSATIVARGVKEGAWRLTSLKLILENGQVMVVALPDASIQ